MTCQVNNQMFDQPRSGVIVAFNIMCMYIQVASDITKEDAEALSKVNEGCLVFYTAEAGGWTCWFKNSK